LAFDSGVVEGYASLFFLPNIRELTDNWTVKPFDIDLNWMSKFRNQEKAAFWMADDDYGML
jgi:hypothetical protein